MTTRRRRSRRHRSSATESGTNRGRQAGTTDALVEEESRSRVSVSAVGVDRRGGRGDGVEGGLRVDLEAREAGVVAFGDQDW